ncbi:alanine--glyoxylate aminotransferase family protein [Cytophagaceae bacterium AH-315-L13]|nr:alanine--glyoxylate aminotransferase family protein [Cytophagaceae bacterium AH-315-L13]
MELETLAPTKFKKLYIPGPTNVHPDVLKKMAQPMIGHRSKQASALQKSITDNLKKLMYTENKIALSTSSGTGLMEGSIRCFTNKKAIVFAVGAFGKRWYDLAKWNDIPCDLHEEEWGNPTLPEMVDKYLSSGKYDVVTITHNETSTGVMNPLESISEVIKKYPDVIWMVDAVSSLAGAKIDVDELGIDVCIASTQKALALPPGLSVCSVSPKGEERLKEVGTKGHYLDIGTILKYIDKKDHQYLSTPNISLMYAMEYQLERIMEEGLGKRFDRHMEMAEYIINWANEHFKTFASPGFESMTLTTIDNTKGISVANLNKELGENWGLQISNGYGNLKEKTFRIAHMGEMTMDDMLEVTKAIGKILKL